MKGMKLFSRTGRAEGGTVAATAVAEPEALRACSPVLPTDPCDRGDCTAKVQVSILTGSGLLGFCIHHGREVFDLLVLRGTAPPQPKYIGDIKPW